MRQEIYKRSVPHVPLNANSFQRANLQKLANGLLTLQPSYNQFDMKRFYYNPKLPPQTQDETGDMSICGSVACAIGHGPHFDIPKEKHEAWHEYLSKNFTTDHHVFMWLFHSYWASMDNTTHGAALRILYALSYGIPKNYETQLRNSVKYFFL